jgi:prophage maintenance system killer protein
VLPGSEPIPPVFTRFPGRLESILGAVKTRALMNEYSVIPTAVAVYVLLARSQAFMNGNKRMSILMSGFFLYLNGLQLLTHPEDFGDLTLVVSKDRKTSIEDLIEILTPFFAKITRPLREEDAKELEALLRSSSKP